MLSFKHIYNAEKAKAVCNMYTDITKTYDGDAGKIWTMTAHFWNNNHEVKVIQSADGNYKYSKFKGEYNGRKCKADSSLKKFENISMMLYALVKCGKLS